MRRSSANAMKLTVNFILTSAWKRWPKARHWPTPMTSVPARWSSC